MKLTRKVSKQRCLSFSGRSFAILPGPFDRLGRPNSFSLKEIPQVDPSEPFSRRWELKLVVRGTVNLSSCIQRFTPTHRASDFRRKEGSG